MKNDELEIKEKISKNIRILRMLNDNISIKELGRRSGINEKVIRRFEKTNYEFMPSLPTLITIANYFDVDVIELLK